MVRFLPRTDEGGNVLLICPTNGPPLRFTLTLAGKAVLLEDIAASVGEDVRRAVGAAACSQPSPESSAHRADGRS